jgi:branched-chain amino acid transport system permease protein
MRSFFESYGLVLFSVCAPLALLMEDYSLYRVTLAAVYAIAIMGLGLLIGLSGQFSVGHSAFFALGAYSAAIPMLHGMSPYLVIPLAGVVGAVVGFAVGIPARRLGFVHLALVTWGLALVIPRILKSSYLERWTLGVQGIYVERPPPPELFGLSDDQWWYLITVALLVFLLWAGQNLSNGRGARALRALKDNPIAAQSLGINVALYKPLIFAISAAFTSIAGALGAILTDFVAPDAYGVFFSILLLIGAVAGGVGSVWGAIPGGLLVQYLPDLAANASAALSFPAYGLMLIGLMYVMPAGAIGLLRRLRTRKTKPPAAP